MPQISFKEILTQISVHIYISIIYLLFCFCSLHAAAHERETWDTLLITENGTLYRAAISNAQISIQVRSNHEDWIWVKKSIDISGHMAPHTSQDISGMPGSYCFPESKNICSLRITMNDGSSVNLPINTENGEIQKTLFDALKSEDIISQISPSEFLATRKTRRQAGNGGSGFEICIVTIGAERKCTDVKNGLAPSLAAGGRGDRSALINYRDEAGLRHLIHVDFEKLNMSEIELFGAPIKYWENGLGYGQLAADITHEDAGKIARKNSIIEFEIQDRGGKNAFSPKRSIFSSKGRIIADDTFLKVGDGFAFPVIHNGHHNLVWVAGDRVAVAQPPAFDGQNLNIELLGRHAPSGKVFVSIESFTRSRGFFSATESDGEVFFDHLWSEPAQFDEQDVAVKQATATVNGRVKVPYREIAKRDRAEPGPALILVYGGYAQPLRPFYLGAFWERWLAKGGSVVFAYPRGDGGFGAQWYEAAETFVDADMTAGDVAAIANELTQNAPGRCVFVRGHSYGGYIASLAGLTAPDQFTGILADNAVFDLDVFRDGGGAGRQIRHYEELARQAGKSLRSPIKFVPVPSASQDLPAFLLRTTADDDRVDPRQSERMRDALVRAGADARLVSFPHGGHEIALSRDESERYTQAGLDFLNEIAEREGCW